MPAMRSSGVPVRQREAIVFGAPYLPPAPRVSVAATPGVPVAVRSDLENPRLDPSGGRTHLRLTIVGGTMAPALGSEAWPPRLPRPAHRPEEVWLYVDASGSMTGEALRAATAAAHVLVRRLHPEDRLAVIAYGERTRVLHALRPVGNGVEAHRSIERIVAGGGAPAGPPRVALRSPRDGTPLVVWVTDAVGFAEARQKHPVKGSAPVVALVVGDGASAADLRSFREIPGLDVKHVPDARALALGIGRALYAHRAAVARDLEIVLSPAPGVRIVGAAGAVPSEKGLSLTIPSLERGQERVVLVELDTPRGSPGDAVHLADFTVVYREASTSEISRSQGRVAAVRARDGDEALATRDRGVARSVLAARTGAALADAGEALARGDVDSARRALEEHEELLAIAAMTLGETWIHRDAEAIGAYARMVRRAPAMFDEGARRRFAARMVFEGDGRVGR